MNSNSSTEGIYLTFTLCRLTGLFGVSASQRCVTPQSYTCVFTQHGMVYICWGPILNLDRFKASQMAAKRARRLEDRLDVFQAVQTVSPTVFKPTQQGSNYWAGIHRLTIANRC